MEIIYKIILWIKDFITSTYTKSKNKYGKAITILWIIIIISIIYSLCTKSQNFILVGLAGLLASASVIRNIESTKQLKSDDFNLNYRKEISYFRFLLYSMRKDLQDISSMQKDIDKNKIIIKEVTKSYCSLKKEIINKETVYLLTSDDEKEYLKKILMSFETMKIYDSLDIQYIKNNDKYLKDEIDKLFYIIDDFITLLDYKLKVMP